MRNGEGYGGTVDLLPSTNTLSGGECLVLTLSDRERIDYCSHSLYSCTSLRLRCTYNFSKKINGLQSCRKGTVGLQTCYTVPSNTLSGGECLVLTLSLYQVESVL